MPPVLTIWCLEFAVTVWGRLERGRTQPAHLPHNSQKGLPAPWDLPLAPPAGLGGGGRPWGQHEPGRRFGIVCGPRGRG